MEKEESMIKQTNKTKKFRSITTLFPAQKKVLLDEETSDHSCNNNFNGKFKLLHYLNDNKKLIINNKFYPNIN